MVEQGGVWIRAEFVGTIMRCTFDASFGLASILIALLLPEVP
ncbi:Uncharacterized protein ToN1_37130 [Aromatoleum petrolei]|nr:Uncharacterized protein ToN1_37130 [Aromatoleum petrolei]